MTHEDKKIYRRRMTGRRKSRVRVGAWPWVAFVLICVIAAMFGSRVEQAFHDWEASHRSGAPH